jgi:hypothetical protein
LLQVSYDRRFLGSMPGLGRRRRHHDQRLPLVAPDTTMPGDSPSRAEHRFESSAPILREVRRHLAEHCRSICLLLTCTARSMTRYCRDFAPTKPHGKPAKPGLEDT